MKLPHTTMQVALAGDVVCVRIAGPAGYNVSVDFKTLAGRCCEATGRALLLDLTQCVNMDSTFLGVLASLSQRTAQPIQLRNANVRIVSQLENLGVMSFFKMLTGSDSPGTDWQPVESAQSPTRRQLGETSLEAHQTLMALNPDNVARFKDVEQFLKESLQCPPP